MAVSSDINDVQAISTDILTSNGMPHVVDNVILPAQFSSLVSPGRLLLQAAFFSDGAAVEFLVESLC